MKRLGVIAPVVTPCSPKGEIDFAGLKSVCDYLIGGGCHGIFACGSTGRGPWFSRNDRVKICQTARDTIGLDKPLWAGCMALGLQDMLDNAKAMKDAGADAAVITSPGYFKYNFNELEKIFLDCADKSPLPVILYDIPVFAGAKLDSGVIGRLAKHPNVAGFKDSSADIDRFKQMINSIQRPNDFYLVQGKEHLLAESIMGGASGIIVSLVHIEPKLFTFLYDLSCKGQSEKAGNLQESITKIKDCVEGCFAKHPETSTLFHILSYFLQRKGICRGITLQHEGEFSSDMKEVVAEILNICDQQW